MRILFIPFFLITLLAFSLMNELAHAAEVSTTTSETAEPVGSPYGSLSANVALTTDYVFRGQSQTDHRPAIQGGLDWSHSSGFYLGTWASNVSLRESPASVEVDGYGGYNYSVTEDLVLSAWATYYSYYRGSDGNTWEFPVQVTWKNLKLAAAYSPHWGGSDAGHAWYVTASLKQPLPWGLSLLVTAGYSFLPSEDGETASAETLEDGAGDGSAAPPGQAVAAPASANYADFRVGLSRDILGMSWDLSAYFVDHQRLEGLDRPTGVLTVSKTF